MLKIVKFIETILKEFFLSKFKVQIFNKRLLIFILSFITTAILGIVFFVGIFSQAPPEASSWFFDSSPIAIIAFIWVTIGIPSITAYYITTKMHNRLYKQTENIGKSQFKFAIIAIFISSIVFFALFRATLRFEFEPYTFHDVSQEELKELFPPSPMPPLFKTSNYTKRQLDLLSKFFYEFNYPLELKRIADNQLVGMRCSYNIFNGDQGLRYNDYVNEAYSDKYNTYELPYYRFYTSLIEQIERSKNIRLTSLNYCQTEDKREFMEYVDSLNGKIFFATITNGVAIDEIVSLDEYLGSCGYPIALTENDMFYYACAGGKSKSYAIIQKIDIGKKTVKSIYSCITDLAGKNPNPPQCKLSID